jgi:hypothetical protein
MPAAELSSVEIFQQLVKVQPQTFDAVSDEIVRQGFSPLDMKVPVRPDIMKVSRQSVFKRGSVTAQLMQSTGREGGFTMDSLSFGIMDKTISLDSTAAALSAWLKGDADMTYPKNRNFRLRRLNDVLSPLSADQEVEWHNHPEGALVFIMASDMGFGVSMNMMMHTANRAH